MIFLEFTVFSLFISGCVFRSSLERSTKWHTFG